MANYSLSDIPGGFPMDAAVHEIMPPGSRVISAEPSGNSAWTITGKVTVILPDGKEKLYFLKCANGPHGRTMLRGEFTSVSTIYSLIPDLVPQPYGWGKYKVQSSAENRYFFLSDFLEMDLSAPNPVHFTHRLAQLHKIATSPNGMFGFEVTTCDGKVPHTVEWESNWATFFTKLLKGVLRLDAETNGEWPELEIVSKQLFDAVIPLLLGVLQSGGKTITPCLIHGDLWEGNVGTLMENGKIVFYDAGSYYAHNEMELGIWRCGFGQMFRQKIYFKNYFLNYPAAEPRQQWEDRNRLYSLKYNLNYSAGHPGSVTRKTAYNDMLFLCEKYAPRNDLQPYDPQNDPTVTGARIKVHE